MSKNTFCSLIPLNWLLRSIGLSNIYLNGCQLAESGSIIKSAAFIICFGFLNVFCMYHKIKTFDTFKSLHGNKETGLVKFADSIQIAYWLAYLEYIIDMYFVYKFGGIALIKYFKGLDNIDSILGNPRYDEIRSKIINCIVISIITYLFNSGFDYISWGLFQGWQSSALYFIDYFYFLLNMLTVLDTISHVIKVEYRLKMIDELLQNSNATSTFEVFVKDTTINVYGKAKKISVNSLNTLSNTRYLDSAWFIRCYLLLLEQVAYVNASYGFRIFVFCLNLLINMINLLNLALRLINGSYQPENDQGILVLLPCISSTLRALNYGGLAIILMYRCEQAYKQNEELVEIVDVLLSSNNSSSTLKTNLQEFRHLIITRPIKFHAAKFFTMDYTVLVSLSSVLVTYTIIMLQSMQ